MGAAISGLSAHFACQPERQLTPVELRREPSQETGFLICLILRSASQPACVE